jgi:hypothetical protein
MVVLIDEHINADNKNIQWFIKNNWIHMLQYNFKTYILYYFYYNQQMHN